MVSAPPHLYRDSVLLVYATHKDTRTDATKQAAIAFSICAFQISSPSTDGSQLL